MHMMRIAGAEPGKSRPRNAPDACGKVRAELTPTGVSGFARRHGLIITPVLSFHQLVLSFVLQRSGVGFEDIVATM
jgi:hypothetical protein